MTHKLKNLLPSEMQMTFVQLQNIRILKAHTDVFPIKNVEASGHAIVMGGVRGSLIAKDHILVIL